MQADGEVGSLLGVAAAGHRPRFHGREAEIAALIGAAASEPRKTLVSRRIGLPQLDGGIRYRIAVAIDDRAGSR